MIKIYGGSDDLVEIEGCTSGDEVGCYEQDVTIVVGAPEATGGANASGLRVTMHYGTGDAGVWEARVSPLDEDVPCPWAVKLTVEGYSAVVEIDAPADTPVTWTLTKARD